MKNTKGCIRNLKKSHRHSGLEAKIIYDLVNKEKHHISVYRALDIIGVSRSRYYDWMDREPSKRSKRKPSKQIYGAPKITEKLQYNGYTVSEKTVGNYMRDMDIRAIYTKKWIKTTVNSDFSSKLKNILKRNFNVNDLNTVWVTDITYIWTRDENFVYLTSVMDLLSRKIIAWEISNNLSVESVTKCISKAKKRRNLDEALIIHSDQGVQYVSKEYKNLFDKNMKRSYSKKGDPWDNACIESFHALIKREWLSRFKIQDIEHAYQLVFEYIETFYSTTRIHGTLGYQSPNEYKKNYKQNKLIN
ncbi:IS3 family transposase [Mycoplasmatota bacterium]|nr:IS3 family transposase [Mycoplasmatota bacterium]